MSSGEASGPDARIDLDVDEIRDPAILLHGLTGADERYTFYYDETNNLRRLHLTGAGLNVREPQIFVLGGILHPGEPRDLDFEALRSALRLQPTVRELKFEHVAKGDFLKALSAAKLTAMLEWLIERDLLVHHVALDPLYWSIVDIIDSIIGASSIGLLAPQLKNDLFAILRDDVAGTAALLSRFDYPDVGQANSNAFVRALIDLLEERRAALSEPGFAMLKAVLEMGLRRQTLAFLQDETPRLLINDLSMIFIDRICLFKNSRHIFDQEMVIERALKARRFMVAGHELGSFRFAASEEEPGVQVSDVVAGLLGKFFSWLNRTSSADIAQSRATLSISQERNRQLISTLLGRSLALNIAFDHQIVSLEDQRRGRLFLH